MNDELKLHPNGLRELPPDLRDFSLGAIYQLPQLSELPAEFILEPLTTKNQGGNDKCTANASCGASELQEGVELNSDYTFAISKTISGDPEAWGQDLRVAMKAHVAKDGQVRGAIEQKDVPPGMDSRRLEDWPPELKTKALEHAKSSFMDCKGPYDAFDNIRASIWLFRDQKRAVVFGLKWGWPLLQMVLHSPQDGSGHAVYAIGWKQIGASVFLVIQNSFGDEAGDHGKFYVSREVVNAYVSVFGAFMFSDMTPEEYRARLRSVGESLIQYALRKIAEWLRLIPKLAPSPVPVPTPAPVPSPALAPTSFTIPHVSRIEPWAKAIRENEGWNINSRSWRNNNPGNLKFTTYTESLGSFLPPDSLGKAIDYDEDGFCKFANYDSGFKALCQFLTAAASNQLRDYHDKTLAQFTLIYAGVRADHPYAENVARALNAKVDIKISELL